MGRKKKKPMKPWCWYCNREFDDEKILIQHQKAKHFKCHICHKKLYTGPGLAIHCMQVHKENIDKVPNALPGRHDIEIEIYGMEGIPEKDLVDHAQKANEQKRKEKEMEQSGGTNPSDAGPSTTVPPMGMPPGMPPMGGMPPGPPGMQQRMPGMQPGMMPGMPPMPMPGMPGMPPGMPGMPPGMPPFPMPPMGMHGMPPMPPGMFGHRPGMPGMHGMPTTSGQRTPFTPNNQTYQAGGMQGVRQQGPSMPQPAKPLFPSGAPTSTASGPSGYNTSQGASSSSSSQIGPTKPTFPAAAYSAPPTTTTSNSANRQAANSGAETTTPSSKPIIAATTTASVGKTSQTTSSSTSKIIHPDEELSLEEMRAGMSKYKKAPSSTSGRFGQSSSGLPPVPGVPAQQQPGPTNMGGNQPNMGGNQPNMAGNMMSQHGMGPQGRMPHQQPGMGMHQGQMQMQQRMGMPGQGMPMNGQRMAQQFGQMGQGGMPGYGMHPQGGMPGMNFPGAPHPGMMGGMQQRMGDGRW